MKQTKEGMPKQVRGKIFPSILCQTYLFLEQLYNITAYKT